MTLRHVKIFLAVCENGCNLTKAAEALFMAQPAVSLAVGELERYYGVKLFDRISRKLYLTEAGEHFREYAVHIASLFDEMEKGMRDWDSIGLLRVGASFTIGSQFMPSYVEAFCAQRPSVEVRVTIGPSDHLEERLLVNELDFALIEGVVHHPNLLSEEYMEDSLAVICSPGGPFTPGRPLSIEEFRRQPFLLREHGSGTREAFESAAQAAGFSVTPLWEGMSTTALVNAAIHGLGIAVLPRRMVQGPLERGAVIALTVEGLELTRTFRIVYHKNKFLTRSAQEFIQLCKDYALDYPIPKYSGLY